MALAKYCEDIREENEERGAREYRIIYDFEREFSEKIGCQSNRAATYFGYFDSDGDSEYWYTTNKKTYSMILTKKKAVAQKLHQPKIKRVYETERYNWWAMEC